MFEFKTYHKINTLFFRDTKKTIIIGEYSEPEFEILKNAPWILKEKIDGTNIRIGWTGETVLIAGKTDNAQLSCGLIDKLYSIFTSKKMKDLELPPIIIYGEGVGRKIGSHGELYLTDGDDYDFIAYDIKINNVWLEPLNVQAICDTLEIRTTSWIKREGIYIDDIQVVCNSFDLDYIPEGFVATPCSGLLTRNGKRIITKLKVDDFRNPDYCFKTQINTSGEIKNES